LSEHLKRAHIFVGLEWPPRVYVRGRTVQAYASATGRLTVKQAVYGSPAPRAAHAPREHARLTASSGAVSANRALRDASALALAVAASPEFLTTNEAAALLGVSARPPESPACGRAAARTPCASGDRCGIRGKRCSLPEQRDPERERSHVPVVRRVSPGSLGQLRSAFARDMSRERAAGGGSLGKARGWARDDSLGDHSND
jgi:hypothetical protein